MEMRDLESVGIPKQIFISGPEIKYFHPWREQGGAFMAQTHRPHLAGLASRSRGRELVSNLRTDK